MNPRRLVLSAVFGILTLSFKPATSAQVIDIWGGGTRVVPITLSGYSAEAASTLKNDLEVMGFEVTTPDKADFTLSGKNSPNVEGRLQKTLSKETLLAKAYTGETIRLQAHALSDDVVQAILGIKGIARTKIAYRYEKSQGNSEIFISDYDGHNAKQVTSDNSLAVSPVWVPKSWHLFYTSYRSGFPWIYSHNLTGGERRPFAKFPGLNSGGVVSPDGKRVAMILSKAGSPDVWVCNIDGTDLRQLTKTREDESSPCWSPNGDRICYAGRPDRRSLFLISANGGQPTRLNTGGFPNPSEPDWSPDGRTIIYTSQRTGGFDLAITEVQTGRSELLVEGEDPSWAANSRTVIFTRRVGKGNNEKRVLSLLDVPTKRVKDTPQISGSRSQPSWAK